MPLLLNRHPIASIKESIFQLEATPTVVSTIPPFARYAATVVTTGSSIGYCLIVFQSRKLYSPNELFIFSTRRHCSCTVAEPILSPSGIISQGPFSSNHALTVSTKAAIWWEWSTTVSVPAHAAILRQWYPRQWLSLLVASFASKFRRLSWSLPRGLHRIHLW